MLFTISQKDCNESVMKAAAQQAIDLGMELLTYCIFPDESRAIFTAPLTDQDTVLVWDGNNFIPLTGHSEIKTALWASLTWNGYVTPDFRFVEAFDLHLETGAYTASLKAVAVPVMAGSSTRH